MRKTPVVLGVLSMVFGGLTLLFEGVSLVSQVFSKQMMGGFGKAFSGLPKQEGQPDMGQMFDRLGKLTEELKVYTYLNGFVLIAFSIALILIGWTLYKRRPRSRNLSVIWAIAALAYIPLQIYIQVKIVLPRTAEITKQMLAGTDAAASGLAQSFTAMQGPATVIMYLLTYPPFPIILLCLMGRASAKNDLVGPAPAPM